MIQELSNKLKELFETLSGVWQPLVSVKDYHTLENNWYPYLTFENVWFEAEILSNCENLRTFIFDVLIFQDILENDRKTAKENINKLIDEILDLLDTNYTLDLVNVKMVNPVSWTIIAYDIQNGKTLVWNLRVEIQTYNSVI